MSFVFALLRLGGGGVARWHPLQEVGRLGQTPDQVVIGIIEWQRQEMVVVVTMREGGGG